MIKKQSLVVLVLLCSSFMGFGQVNIAATGTNYTINFDTSVSGVNNGQFAGTGFQPIPAAGQLDSDAWAVTGWSDGALAFSGTRTTGDYARGNVTAAVISGGMYSFGSGDIKLMIQPSGSDWVPGTLTLRIQNNTGITITDFNVAYDLFIRNDQTRSNSFNFSYSSDNTTYTPVAALDYTSIAAADALGMVLVGTRSTTINSLSIANGASFYIRWSGADVGGSGSRDEFALDNVIVSGSSTPAPELQLVDDTAANQNCGYTIDFGTKAISTSADLTFDVKNLGSLDLNVTSFGITGDYTIVSPATPFTVTSGNSQTVTVRFTPSINGTSSGILTINNNDANEGGCTVNLTGIGFTPTPEINVEGNLGFFPDIANGATTPSGTNNTLFAAQLIGASQSKSYRINNEGTADLILSGISIIGNLGDFSVSISPSNTINPSTYSILEITFSPIASGVRSAVVSIANNDSDENPFTFTIEGIGNCVSSSLAITPSSGPIGTTIIVTGTNFGASTTTTLRGINAIHTVLSSTTMEVVVPNNVSTGNLVVVNDSGCTSSILFNVIDKTVGGCEGGNNLSDLIISEVTDSTTGGVTYIEIYNGTGGNVQLNNYSLEVYSNGNSTPSGTINPLGPGNLANNTTYVIAIGVAGTPDTSNTCSIAGGNGELADITSGTGGINKKDNQHDAIRLLKSSGTVVVDQFGVYQDNTWMDATSVTGDRGFDFRRLITASPLPNPNFNINDWNIIDWAGSGQSSCSINDYSDIDVYDFSTASTPSISTQPMASSSTCDLTATLSVVATEGFIGSNPLAYQWYYSAPGDSGWTAVPSALPYSGETSNVLNISNTIGLNGYQYYCQVRENTITCYKASNAVRLDVYSTTWDGSLWSNGMPTIGTIATINGNYNTSLNGSFSACRLTVNANYNLTVNNGDYVEVENDVTVNGQLFVRTQGNFVQNNDSALFTDNTINGVVVSKSKLMQKWYSYTYWSSPVVNETIEGVLGNTPINRRFKFEAANYIDTQTEIGNTNIFTPGPDGLDDNGNDWQPATGAMIPGTGYAATASEFGPDFPRTEDFDFYGEFNNGIITSVLINNSGGAYDDWNFIGNPYPGAISADEFFNINSTLVDVIYLWDQATPPSSTTSGSQNSNFSADDYAIINGIGEIGARGDTGLPPNRFVPSGQGFFVEALNTGDVIFKNSMRSIIADNSQFFRKSNSKVKSSSNNKLWVNLSSDNGIFNQIMIGYVKNASNKNDGSFFDTKRVLTPNRPVALYSIIEDDNGKFAIQGKDPNSLNLDEVIPLGFYTAITGATLYKLSIAQLEGDFLTSNTMYLKDNLLNKVHNLTASDYSFTSEVGEFKDRFEIVFQSEALSDIEAQLNLNNLTIIELSDGRIQIKTNSIHTINAVEILDMLGRTLYQLKGTSTTEIYNLNTLSQAAYIAKVELSNGQIITKKAVKRN